MKRVMKPGVLRGLWLTVACAILWMGSVNRALAHCDTMNGPVIVEAKAALEKGDVTSVLKWVKKESEPEIKAAFARAVAVRATGPEAKALADQYFLETLVRIHRAGEGAPYSGIKDEPVEPVVAMADQALADGSARGMVRELSVYMAGAIQDRFDRAQAARKSRDTSVEAGREYVEAYVTYMHFVEGIHAAILADPSHLHEAAAEAKSGNEEHGKHNH